jgi:hypothetical protein
MNTDGCRIQKKVALLIDLVIWLMYFIPILVLLVCRSKSFLAWRKSMLSSKCQGFSDLEICILI